MIIPNPWLTNIRQDGIRRLITNNTRIVEIVHFLFPIFPKATVDTEIVVLQRDTPDGAQPLVTIAPTLPAFVSSSSMEGLRRIQHVQHLWRDLDGDPINIFIDITEQMMARACVDKSVTLSSLCEINVGIKPYQVGKGKPSQTRRVVDERTYDSDHQVHSSYRPYLRGADIGRYRIQPVVTRFISYGPWLAEPRPAADFDAPTKIFMRQTGDSLVAALDTDQYLCLNNMHVLVPKESLPSVHYILGVVNSRLLNWFYHTLNPEIGEALAEVKRTNVAKLPIRTIDFDHPADVARHDKMVGLVEKMLDLHQRLAETKTPTDRNRLQRQITATDQAIDTLVYELYDLTDEEIAIVEQATDQG